MTLQEFDRYINVIREQHERESAFGDAIDKFTDGNGGIFICTDKLVASFIELLQSMFNDNTSISWFMYEWDYGTREVVGEDGTINYGFFIYDIPVPMANTYDLFNYLMWTKTDLPWDGTYKFDAE
jgi:hypothetical protein